SHWANARRESISAACRVPGNPARLPPPRRMRCGRDDSRAASTSPSECAGSVETASTWRPPPAPVTARAAAHVVLPTPPLPAKNVNLTLSFFLVSFDFYARDLVVRGQGEGPGPGPSDLADPGKHVALDLGEG